MGIEKLEPTVPRKDVDRRVFVLRKEQIRNTALRFRFQMLLQRYNTYQTHWQRICRDIENGTYKRHVVRAQKRFGIRRPNEPEPQAPAPETMRPPQRSAAEELAELDREFAPPEALHDGDVTWEDEPPTATLPPKSAHLAPESARAPATLRPPKAPPSRPAPRTPRTGPPSSRPGGPRTPQTSAAPASQAGPRAATAPASAASPQAGARAAAAPPSTAMPQAGARAAPSTATPGAVGIPLPNTASPTTARAAPAAPASARGPGAPAGPIPVRPDRPAVAAKPAHPRTPLSPAAPPPAASVRRDPDLAEDRVRQLYSQYVETRRRQNESTASITYDSVARSLRESSAKLRQKLGRSVDFEVAIKDGRTILRPVVK